MAKSSLRDGYPFGCENIIISDSELWVFVNGYFYEEISIGTVFTEVALVTKSYSLALKSAWRDVNCLFCGNYKTPFCFANMTGIFYDEA